VERRAKRFTDGRCLYWGEFNPRAADCAVRKKAATFKAAGAEVEDVGPGARSEESGTAHVNLTRMSLHLTVKVLFQML